MARIRACGWARTCRASMFAGSAVAAGFDCRIINILTSAAPAGYKGAENADTDAGTFLRARAWRTRSSGFLSMQLESGASSRI